MKIAFDFDGTITAHPQKMNQIACAFYGMGHLIVVLTAAAGELPPKERPAEVKRRLAHYGFSCTHQLACVEGCDKGKWCAENGVDVVFDDDPNYLKTIQDASPQTLRLLVN